MKSWNNLILAVLIILPVTQAGAQQIQQELASGPQKFSFQAQWVDQPLSDTPLEVTGLAFFGKFSKSESATFDEAVVQAAALWNINSLFKSGTELFYSNHAGLQYGIAFQYSARIGGWNLKVTPVISYANRTGMPMVKATLLAEKEFSISNNLQFGLSGIVTGSWNEFQMHDRSLAQLRVGPVFSDLIQIGAGYDYDGYGPDLVTKNQFNLFIKKKF